MREPRLERVRGTPSLLRSPEAREGSDVQCLTLLREGAALEPPRVLADESEREGELPIGHGRANLPEKKQLVRFRLGR